MLYANDPLPLYRQLYDRLRQDIENRRLVIGAKLPSERQLAAEYGISRLTARKALSLLQQAGYISAHQGKGSFVIRDQVRGEPALLGFTETAIKHGLKPSSRVLKRTVLPASPAIAEQLDIPVNSKVILIKRLRLVDDRPVALDTSYLPYDLCQQILDFDLEQHSLYATLERRLHIHLQHAEQMTEAILGDETILRLLKLSSPAALMRIKRRSFSEEGRVVEYTGVVLSDQYLKTDLHRYRI